MKKLYFSEVLNRYFENETECIEAEHKYNEKVTAEKEAEKKLKEEKSKRAKEIEDAYKAYRDAEKTYIELRNKFIEDYGQFHMTVREQTPVTPITLLDMFNSFWF